MEFSANEDVVELARSINTAMDVRTKPLHAKIEQLQAELDKHRWIPVAERLPEVSVGPLNKCSEHVWLIHKGKTEQGYYTNFTGWRICGSYFDENTVQREITHWKPIILPGQALKENDMDLIDKIQGALSDPKAPWYGSDVVAWVADLIEEYGQLQAENKQLKEALSPFVSFKQFLDALRECQQEEPLTEHSCIVSLMGSGASDYIWYGDLMRADKALKENND